MRLLGLKTWERENQNCVPACNVAVLMLKGMCNNWKQPLAYFLLHSTFPATKLTSVIIQSIKKLQEIDCKIIAFVTDMGGNFMQMAKALGVTESSPFFIVNEQQIAYFVDPPHAIKAIRNNFYKNNIKYKDTLILWKFVEQFYEIDKRNEMRLAPKLTDCHVAPNNFRKMKVCYATQVLSATIAAGLEKLIISRFILNEDALVTVDFIRKMNDLFDIFNSSTVVYAVKYRQAFTGQDYQIQFLKEIKEYLNHLTVFSKNGTDISNKVRVLKY